MPTNVQSSHGSDLEKAAKAVERADIEIGHSLAQGRDKPAVKLVAKLGKLGDQEPLYAISGVLLTVGLLTGRRQLAMAGLRMGLAVGAADLAKSGVKRLVTRTRPHVLMDEGVYERHAGEPDRKPDQSFPSGHMAGATAAVLAVSRVYPGFRPYGLIASVVLAWSRISKGAHWPLDVAAGALIGLSVETIVHGGFKLIRRAVGSASAERRPPEECG